eukprot:258880-Amphidinium_carterae.1
MALVPWTGSGSGDRARVGSHGYTPTSLLQFGSVPIHGTGTLTSLLQSVWGLSDRVRDCLSALEQFRLLMSIPIQARLYAWAQITNIF